MPFRESTLCLVSSLIMFGLVVVNPSEASPDKLLNDTDPPKVEKRIEIRVKVDGDNVKIEGLENGKKIDLEGLGSVKALLKKLPQSAQVGADVTAIFVGDDDVHAKSSEDTIKAILKGLPVKLRGKVDLHNNVHFDAHDASDEADKQRKQIRKIVKIIGDDAKSEHEADGNHQMKVWVDSLGEKHDLDHADKMIVVKLAEDGEHPNLGWTNKEGNTFTFKSGDDHQMIFLPRSSGKFMLGLALQPIGDLIRSQLQLDDHVGIAVESVIPGSAADEAGLSQYDVIITVNGNDVHELEDLTGPIEAAGKKKSAVKIGFVRGGEQMSTKVKPRSTAPAKSAAAHDHDGKHESGSEFRSLRKELQELRAAVEELKSAINE